MIAPSFSRAFRIVLKTLMAPLLNVFLRIPCSPAAGAGVEADELGGSG